LKNIIDIHGHYYSKNLYPNWVPYGLEPLKEWWSNPSIKAVAISSLDVFSKGINENNKVSLLCMLNNKLWQFATIDPRIPRWWEKVPKDKKILGIKIHPTWSNYPLTDYFDEILNISRDNNWAILTHSEINEPYINIKKSIAIADNYPDVPVIFAHLGNGFSGYK